MLIVMAMSIARPIKAGRTGPKKAGNQRKANRPGLNNKRPGQPKPNSKGPSNRIHSSLTAATRPGSRVIKGHAVTTRHRDVPTAAEAAAEAEVGAADVVDDFLHLCALGHEWRGLILNSE